MIFSSYKDEKSFTIKAHPEKESEWYGYRHDGTIPLLKLTGTEVTFEHPVKSIHPDLLALLCVLYFFPFCKDKVTFPEPVSGYFQEAFSESNLPLREMVDGSFKPTGYLQIQNLDKTLGRFSGSNMSLAFGGGTDSMAAHVLFPEALLVHELSRDTEGRIIPDKTADYIREVREKEGKAISIVSNGRRCITEPSGWSTWVGSSASAVLLATDMDIGYIMRGTNSDSLFFIMGRGFKEVRSEEEINPWFKAFNHIGLKHFSPVASMTEAGTMKICQDAGVLGKTVSCQKNEGGECYSCFKCFRKDSLANTLGYRSFRKKYWKRYKTAQVLKGLNRKPLLQGHIYRYTLPELYHMKWVRGSVDHMPDPSPFILDYYEPGITLMTPKELHEEIKNRVEKYLDPVTEIEAMKSWKQPVIKEPEKVKNPTDKLKAKISKYIPWK